MCGPRATELITEQVATSTSAYLTRFTTPWMLMIADGSASVRVFEEIEALEVNYRHKAQWRTAAVVQDLPGSWTLGSVRTQNGANVQDFTPGSGSLWFQAGIAASVPSVTGEALVSLRAVTKGNDQIVGNATIQTNPDVNSGDYEVFQVGKRFPAFGLTRLMFGIVYTGWGSGGGGPTVTYVPVVRYYDQPRDAGAWATLSGNPNPTSTAVNAQTNVLDSSPTNSTMWAEVGLKVSTATRAQFQVVAAAKY